MGGRGRGDPDVPFILSKICIKFQTILFSDKKRGTFCKHPKYLQDGIKGSSKALIFLDTRLYGTNPSC